MKDLFRHFRYVLQRNWFTLVIFEIAYRAAGYMLAVQVMRQAVNFSLEMAGYSNLTAENFTEFLKHPTTLTVFGLVTILLILLITVEIASLLVCFQYSSENRKIYISDMFFVGARQTFRLMQRRPLLWIGIMILVSPFLEIHFLVREVSYVKLLQYGVQLIYKMIPYQELLAGVGILLLLISYSCSFSLPFLFWRREGFVKVCEGETVFAFGTAGGIWQAVLWYRPVFLSFPWDFIF